MLGRRELLKATAIVSGLLLFSPSRARTKTLKIRVDFDRELSKEEMLNIQRDWQKVEALKKLNTSFKEAGLLKSVDTFYGPSFYEIKLIFSSGGSRKLWTHSLPNKCNEKRLAKWGGLVSYQEA